MGVIYQKIYEISSEDYINFTDVSHGFFSMGFNELLQFMGHHQDIA